MDEIMQAVWFHKCCQNGNCSNCEWGDLHCLCLGVGSVLQAGVGLNLPIGHSAPTFLDQGDSGPGEDTSPYKTVKASVARWSDPDCTLARTQALCMACRPQERCFGPGTRGQQMPYFTLIFLRTTDNCVSLLWVQMLPAPREKCKGKQFRSKPRFLCHRRFLCNTPKGIL